MIRAHRRGHRWRHKLRIVLIGSLTILGTMIGTLIFSKSLLSPYIFAGIFCGVSWIWTLRIDRKNQSRTFSQTDLLKHFESQYPQAIHSLQATLKMESESEVSSRNGSLTFWMGMAQKDLDEINQIVFHVLRCWLYGIAGTLILCLALGGLFHQKIYESSLRALAWIPAFRKEDTLLIIEGITDTRHPRKYRLSLSAPPMVRVSEDNFLQMMIRSQSFKQPLSISMNRWFPQFEESNREQSFSDGNLDQDSTKVFSEKKTISPSLLSMAKEGGGGFFIKESYQSLRTHILESEFTEPDKKAVQSLLFRVEKNSAVFVDSISKTKPVAYVILGNTLSPEVGLLLNQPMDLSQTVSDEEWISVRISAVSPYPLSELQLVIQTQRGESYEKIASIMSNDQLTVVENYSVKLSPYIFENEEHVHLIGQAVSLVEGKKLVGRSDPLALRVTSSYGRYKEVLSQMTKIKNELMSGRDSQLQKLKKMTEVLNEESLETSFFHRGDRQIIADILKKARDKKIFSRSEERFALLNEINQFLELHEALDDEQRDRDFFVAIRAYSLKASIMTDQKQNQDLKAHAENIHQFLEEREDRWFKRAEFLDDPEFFKEHQDKIGQSYFSDKWLQIDQNMRDAVQDLIGKKQQTSLAKEQATEDLNAFVAEYRQWLEQLESRQRQAKQEKALRHRQSFSAFESLLKRLQKKQDHISSLLDSGELSEKQGQKLLKQWQEQISSQWSEIKNHQKQAWQQTQDIHRKISQRHPDFPTQRLQGATQAMQGVMMAGENGDFDRAEILADRASRLLRLSRQEVREHRQQSQNRQNLDRRKSVVGNQYYGSSITDVVIEKNHQVDKNYRGEVLEGMGDVPRSEDERTLHRRYLREVLR